MTKIYQAVWLFILPMMLIGCSELTIYSVPDTLPHSQKAVALLVTAPTTQIAPEITHNITSQIEQRLNQFSGIKRLVQVAQIEEQLASDQDLLAKLTQFTASYSQSGVVFKDISHRISESFNVDQLFIIQINKYPCADCESGDSLLMKFHLVNANTGEVLWRGRLNHELADEEADNGAINELALRTTNELLDEFADYFTIPWHRMREEHLKSNQI